MTFRVSSELVYSSDSWCSDRSCFEGVVLGESSSRPDRRLLKSSARVSNERNVRHARCAKQEQCRGETLWD